MSTSGVGGVSSQPADTSKLPSQADAFGTMTNEDFINLMISEMQNQDPMNPMDTSQMMDQLGQMQSIQATTTLTSTLNSMALGSGLATSGSLIGHSISGLDDAGNKVIGTVDSASINNGTPYVNVAEVDSSGNATGTISSVQLTNIGEIF